MNSSAAFPLLGSTNGDPSIGQQSSQDDLTGTLFRRPAIVSPEQELMESGATVVTRTVVAESSTSPRESPRELWARITHIFRQACDEVFEDGMDSGFSRAISHEIAFYGQLAVDTISQIALREDTNTEVLAEVLRIFGRIHHKGTFVPRLWLIERGLYHPAYGVRDAAALGLGYLDDRIAIEPLRAAIGRERVDALRSDMEAVVAQLEGTNLGEPDAQNQKG